MEINTFMEKLKEKKNDNIFYACMYLDLYKMPKFMSVVSEIPHISSFFIFDEHNEKIKWNCILGIYKWPNQNLTDLSSTRISATKFWLEKLQTQVDINSFYIFA